MNMVIPVFLQVEVYEVWPAAIIIALQDSRLHDSFLISASHHSESHAAADVQSGVCSCAPDHVAPREYALQEHPLCGKLSGGAL